MTFIPHVLHILSYLMNMTTTKNDLLLIMVSLPFSTLFLIHVVSRSHLNF
jgi:hypothetical protein